MKNKNIGPKKITKSVLDADYKKELRIKNRKKREAKAAVEAAAKDFSIEVPPTKKKKRKKKPGTELAVLGTSTLKVADKRVIKSYFGDHKDSIMDMIKVGDADTGIAMLKKTLLLTVIRILPAAEDIMTESGTTKGTYQFITLISQIRELMADIQADGDRRFLARSVMESIVKPAFVDLAQDLINDHHQFRKESKRYVKAEKAQDFSSDLQNLAMNLAAKMNVKYTEIGSKLEEALKN